MLVLTIACLFAAATTCLILRTLARHASPVRTTDDALATAWWVALHPSSRDLHLHGRPEHKAAVIHFDAADRPPLHGCVVVVARDLTGEGELILRDSCLDEASGTHVIRLATVQRVSLRNCDLAKDTADDGEELSPGLAAGG